MTQARGHKDVHTHYHFRLVKEISRKVWFQPVLSKKQLTRCLLRALALVLVGCLMHPVGNLFRRNTDFLGTGVQIKRQLNI